MFSVAATSVATFFRDLSKNEGSLGFHWTVMDAEVHFFSFFWKIRGHELFPSDLRSPLPLSFCATDRFSAVSIANHVARKRTLNILG